MSWRQVSLLSLGFLLGAVVCLSLKPIVNNLREKEVTNPPAPLDESLWSSKSALHSDIDKANERECLVFLGDSITDRVEVGELIEMRGGTVFNRGISGDTTAGVLQRVSRSFPPNVAVCIILIGYNDIKQGGLGEEAAGRIETLVELMVSRYSVAHVVVETIPHSAERATSELSALNRRILGLALKERVSVLNLQEGFCGGAEHFFVDGIHLSPAGVRRRVELEIGHLEIVKPHLAKRMHVHIPVND